jgi:hypothetical protein
MADFSSLIEFFGSVQGLVVAMAGTLIIIAVVIAIVDSIVIKQRSPQIAKAINKIKHKKQLAIAGFFLFFLVAMPLMGGVQIVLGAGTISPDSGTFEKDLPIFVNVQGLTADTRYTVYTVQDTTATLILNMTSSTAGKLTFSVIFTEAGEGRLEVRDVTGVTTDCSANFLISDMTNDVIIPLGVWYAIITITIAFLFGITGLIVSKVKKAV